MTNLVIHKKPAVTPEEIFAPVNPETIDEIISAYERDEEKLLRISRMIKDEGAAGLICNHMLQDIRASSVKFSSDEEAIRASLSAEYWGSLISKTDILDFMTQSARSEWQENIDKKNTPPFDRTQVISTLQHLTLQRSRFFAEMVDEVFKNLSCTHITNRPEGFSKRMIFMTYSYSSYDKWGAIATLRYIIAKLIGRDLKGQRHALNNVDTILPADGKWREFDAGTIKIRRYKKGTVHVEVHPDLAWRLNAILSTLYPNQIPASFKQQKPKMKEFVLTQKFLQPKTLDLLSSCRLLEPGGVYPHVKDGKKSFYPEKTNSYWVKTLYCENDKEAGDEARHILKSLGMKQEDTNGIVFYGEGCFSYNVKKALAEVVRLGVFPEQKSHQTYTTPEWVAKEMVEEACLSESDTVLEPSAWVGGVADLMQGKCKSLTCVEIAHIYAFVLKQKGHDVVHSDFLMWANKTPQRFDKVVMNPPYSKGRLSLHLKAAHSLLNEAGEIIALVPNTAEKVFTELGMTFKKVKTYVDVFEDAKVTVSLYHAYK